MILFVGKYHCKQLKPYNSKGETMNTSFYSDYNTNYNITWHLSLTIVCLSNIQIWGSTGRERFPGNKMPVTNIMSNLIIPIKINLVLTF